MKLNTRVIWTIIIGGCVAAYFSNTTVALARWATPEDSRDSLKAHTTIYVKKDGTAKQINENECILLKEDSKTIWTNVRIEYNCASSSCKILNAKTIINDENHVLDNDQIEDKPVSSNFRAFDQINHIRLAYPKLDINAKTLLKTQRDITSTSLPNYFYKTINFSELGYTTHNTINIVSEMPLFIEKNDPTQLLSIKQYSQKQKNKTQYFIDITQTKPLIKGIVNEDQSFITPKDIPCITLSSIKDWATFGHALSVDYENIRKASLPLFYQEIVDAVKNQNDAVEKINTVNALLNEKIHYIPDLKTIGGRYIPQTLAAVTQTRVGDCKDFALATSLILENLGIPSKIAFIKKGLTEQDLPLNLPSFAYFNHVILKVDLPEQTVWIDPSQYQSMAIPTSPEIADRRALVLDGVHSHIEHIPAIAPTSNTMTLKETFSMKKLPSLKISGKTELTGFFAKQLTGAQRLVSIQTIKDILMNQANDDYGKIIDKKIQLPNLMSKIVKPISYEYEIQSLHSGLKTNSGLAMPFQFRPLKHFETKQGAVSDLYLGPPQVLNIQTTINDIRSEQSDTLNCDIKSPWASFSRKVEYKPNQIIINQILTIKKSWIQSSELDSKTYKDLQLAFAKNVNNGIAIIFKNS